MKDRILPPISRQPQCPKCGASTYKSGENATHIRYRCLSGKHTVVQLKPQTSNKPPKGAA